MGRIAAQQELIGKPGLPTPQGEVRSLAGSCRAPGCEPAQASGCPKLLWSTSDAAQLGPKGPPSWPVNGSPRIWLQSAGEVLISRPVSVQVALILVTSKFGWDCGRNQGTRGLYR